MKKGFTLLEILVAVMVVTILVAMATPMYEKAIEKSRKAGVIATLKKLHESKMRMMDTAGLITYSNTAFGFENMDFTIPCTEGVEIENNHRVVCKTKDFDYYIAATGSPRAVCARRNRGDYQGTVFVYHGELKNNAALRFLCSGSGCEVYGMSSTSGLSCSK